MPMLGFAIHKYCISHHWSLYVQRTFICGLDGRSDYAYCKLHSQDNIEK